MATNAKNEAFTKEFLQSVLEILWNFIRDSNNRDASVLKFHHPEQLMNMMDFSLPEAPRNLQQILSDCKHTLNHQVKTGKYMVGQINVVIPELYSTFVSMRSMMLHSIPFRTSSFLQPTLPRIRHHINGWGMARRHCKY